MNRLSPLRDRAAIVGVGHTGCTKDEVAPPPVVWIRAIREAVADAGLEVSDVDGIASYHTSPIADALTPTPYYLGESLGLPGLNWYGGQLGQGYAVGVLGAAAEAVAVGHCDVAVAIHAMRRPSSKSAVPYNYLGAQQPGGLHAFLAPYGMSVFMQYIAAWFSRYMAHFEVTREQIGRLVVAQRTGAVRNPNAVMRTPLTLDDYLTSRWISEPMCLLDADMPVNAAVAYVLTSAERARDLKQRPVYVAHAGTCTGPRGDFAFHHDYTEMFPKRFADRFWARAGYSPSDLSFANVHDGFSFYVLYWLEALGIVGRGQAGPFLGDGGADWGTGSLPINTHGGNLSEGRLQGGGHVIEAVLQLRGEAGPRQLKDPQVGIVSAGGIPTVTAAVLHR